MIRNELNKIPFNRRIKEKIGRKTFSAMRYAHEVFCHQSQQTVSYSCCLTCSNDIFHHNSSAKCLQFWKSMLFLYQVQVKLATLVASCKTSSLFLQNFYIKSKFYIIRNLLIWSSLYRTIKAQNAVKVYESKFIKGRFFSILFYLIRMNKHEKIYCIYI